MVREQWTIVESNVFQKDVVNFLTEFELDALRHHLVREPLAGKVVVKAPWLRQINLGRQRPIVILYSISIDRNLIRLIEIGDGTTIDGIDPSVTDKVGEVAKEIGKKGAGWLVGRGLWELVKKLLGIDG